MPIKSRKALGSLRSKTDDEPKVVPPPKPASNIKIVKRKPNATKLVYTDGDILVVKTPAACTRWDNSFRVHVVADYVAPKTIKRIDEYEKHFIHSGLQNKVYRVQGKRVMVRNTVEHIKPPYLVVLRTEVIDLSNMRKMFLYHKDPAMRILMIYSFLTETDIAGVPQFDISEYDPTIV